MPDCRLRSLSRELQAPAMANRQRVFARRLGASLPIAGFLLLLLAAAGSLTGCAAPVGCAASTTCDRTCVSNTVAGRMGTTFGPAPCNGNIVLPNGASLQDGLVEDEAVVIALW